MGGHFYHTGLGDAMSDDQNNILEDIEVLKNKTRALSLYAQALKHFNEGRMSEARSCANNAIENDPKHSDAFYMMAVIEGKVEKYDLAEHYIRRALDISPLDPRYLYTLAEALWSQGENAGALACYQQILQVNPSYDNARWAYTMAQIPIIYNSAVAQVRCRQKFERELDKLDQWFDEEKLNRGHHSVGTHQPFYLSYQEENNRGLFEKHGALCTRLMRAWIENQASTHVQKDIEDTGRIRIGIVSARIRDSSVWHAIAKGWFIHLDRDCFDIHLFNVSEKCDEVTSWAKTEAVFYESGQYDLKQWVDLILGQHLDILIYPDIGMDEMPLKLASLRLVDNQVVSWGVPETTGLPTIDYFLSANEFEPHDADQYYSENLILLPNLGCTYAPLDVVPKNPDLEKLGISHDRILYICPGLPFKYVPKHDEVLTKIAHRVGRCQFIFFVSIDRYPKLAKILRHRLEHEFVDAGLDPHEYLRFITWQPRPLFFGLLKRADIYLDTIGFSGFNTAMQAAECGIPIVTREGEYLRGRFASGILKRMDMPELVAHTNEEYVELAIRLAIDERYRCSVRKRIETNSSILFNDLAAHDALEKFFLRIAT